MYAEPPPIAGGPYLPHHFTIPQGSHPMAATDCTRTNKPHRFDSLSGWCHNGCGVRDDGRVTTRKGDVIYNGPTYQTEQLENFRNRSNA